MGACYVHVKDTYRWAHLIKYQLASKESCRSLKGKESCASAGLGRQKAAACGRLLALYRSQHSPVNQNALTRTKAPLPAELSRSSWRQACCSSAFVRAGLGPSSRLTLVSSCDAAFKQNARTATGSTFLSLHRSLGVSFTLIKIAW